MQLSKKVLFISDLHLDETCQNTVHKFQQFITQLTPNIEALYILGDFFEVWIGDDEHAPFHQNIITLLREVTQKICPIYFLPGNRDFLIGQQFLHETGCQLLSDEESISLFGTRVLIMHGDTLCTQDKTYLRARKLAHNKLLQHLFLLLPLSFRKKIVKNFRKKSLKHTHSVSPYILDVDPIAVKKVMEKHHVSYLIHGHTHRMGMHHFVFNQEKVMRIVLDAWHDFGNVLEWHENGTKRLFHF